MSKPHFRPRPRRCCASPPVRDGHPPLRRHARLHPTWYLWEDGRVLINMDEGRVRLRHLRRDPRVTLTVLDSDNWYTHVTLIGRVAEMRDDEGLADIDRLSRHYSGDAYPDRERSRVSAWVEVERWHGWGALKDSDQSG